MERPSFWVVFSETRDITVVVLALILFVLVVIGGAIGLVVGTVYFAVYVHEFVHITLGMPNTLAFIASGITTTAVVLFIINLGMYLQLLAKWILWTAYKTYKETGRKPLDRWFNSK